MNDPRMQAYTSARPDVLALVPLSARRVLELGCSSGATAALLRERQACTITGVERDPELAVAARRSLDDVVVRDLNDPAWPAGLPAPFDCIIAADVLEHLIDPWATLRRAVSMLTPGGCVVLSLPNAGHLQTILNLVRGRWPYRSRGVHDATHLRFFTLREIRALCGTAGLRVERVARNRRFLDMPSRWDALARFAPYGLRELVTYQYVVRGRFSGTPETVPAESAPYWLFTPERAFAEEAT